jgi:Flp pilus assembly protein TadG
MSFVSNSRRRGGLGCAGVTSLELALVIVPFLWMLLGIFDLGRYLFTVQSMVTLMTDAQRTVLVAVENQNQTTNFHGLYTLDEWSAATGAVLPPLLFDTAHGQVNVTFQGGYGVTQVQVQVIYPFHFLPLFWFLDPPKNLLQEAAIYSY